MHPNKSTQDLLNRAEFLRRISENLRFRMDAESAARRELYENSFHLSIQGRRLLAVLDRRESSPEGCNGSTFQT